MSIPHMFASIVKIDWHSAFDFDMYVSCYLNNRSNVLSSSCGARINTLHNKWQISSSTLIINHWKCKYDGIWCLLLFNVYLFSVIFYLMDKFHIQYIHHYINHLLDNIPTFILAFNYSSIEIEWKNKISWKYTFSPSHFEQIVYNI